MKKILVVMLILTVMFSNQFVGAADKKINPWRDCGIGAMLFPNDSFWSVISNITWDLGSTAVTSYLSSKDTCEGKTVAAAVFIDKTYAQIEQETAKGSGDHVTAMLDILGCESASQAAITTSLRNQLASLVQDPAYLNSTQTQKAQAYFGALDSTISTQFAQQCSEI